MNEVDRLSVHNCECGGEPKGPPTGPGRSAAPRIPSAEWLVGPLRGDRKYSHSTLSGLAQLLRRVVSLHMYYGCTLGVLPV